MHRHGRPRTNTVLYLASAVAKGKDMQSTQLTFDLENASWTGSLASLRGKNNALASAVDDLASDEAGDKTYYQPRYDSHIPSAGKITDPSKSRARHPWKQPPSATER